MEAKEGCLGSHRWQLEFQTDISESGVFPLRSVGSKPKAELPSLEHQNKEKIKMTSAVKSSGVSVLQEKMAGNVERHLKDQNTKFCLQPFSLEHLICKASHDGHLG